MAGNELKPVNCGCGGEAKVYETPLKDCEGYFVQCNDCRTATFIWLSEAEAITAWNTSMGERTAKVEGNRCTVCDNYIRPCMKYCDHCGAKLDWSNHE